VAAFLCLAICAVLAYWIQHDTVYRFHYKRRSGGNRHHGRAYFNQWPISINGQTVQAVFDEQTNSWEMNEFGTDDQPTVTLVIALASLNIIPSKAQSFVRIASGENFFITEVKISTGNVELIAKNKTKRNG
jgi:hypothetical protein